MSGTVNDSATGPVTRTIRHAAWPAPALPAAQPAAGEEARGLAVTDRAVLRHGVPFVPVSGEIHYSRLPRARWAERLRQLRASGVTVASTYVFWLHHVAERRHPRFDGNLDIAAFIDECAAAGLDVCLRIGPWAHGEARNGGFPDWVQRAPVEHRTDDPGYLGLVAEWFGQLADALAGRAQPGGPIIAVQLENELYDRPEHLLTLKRLARDAGIAAPLWTATGWGGAQLPPGEVFPLFGGYADGFWVDPQAGWDATFRAHYFPSHDWDDPGVGADVRVSQGFAAASATAELHGFPPATCELGGGMATAYHRRPVLDGRDVAALAHVKIGNGSAWQGYYMFVGGTNPGPDMQETQATGYPNDMTPLGYDFHAPIGQSGDLAASAPLLRQQHAFLAAFGDRLGDMASALPDARPTGLDDRETLRWALRGDGSSGFVVISHHQPHEPVSDVPGASLRVDGAAGGVNLPAVDVPAGTLARWPIALPVGGAVVDYATASALTVLPGPVLVLMADAGVPAHVSVDGDARTIDPGRDVHRIGGLDVLVLPGEAPVWVREPSAPAASAGRELLWSDAELSWDDAELRVRSENDDTPVDRFDPEARTWTLLAVAPRGAATVTAVVEAEVVRAPGIPPRNHGFSGPRHSAPASAAFERDAAVYDLALPAWASDAAHDAVLDIDWAGDVAELRVDGTPVDDRYWDGTRWSVSLQDVGIAPDSRVSLHVLPLHRESTIGLPDAARRRLATVAGDALCAVDAVALRSRGPWRTVS